MKPCVLLHGFTDMWACFFCGLKHYSSEIIFTSLICFFIVTSVLMGKKGEHAIENYAHSEKKIMGVSALLFSFTLKFNWSQLQPFTMFNENPVVFL